MDHSLCGVSAGGARRKIQREIHLTNVSEIERASSITYSTDKRLCVHIFREPFVLLHLKKAQWEC